MTKSAIENSLAALKHATDALSILLYESSPVEALIVLPLITQTCTLLATLRAFESAINAPA